jgi:hypothetical protein
MRPPVTVITQPRKVLQPVRIRPAPPCNVMDRPHCPIAAMLTHPITPLEHLHPTLRIHRIPASSPIRYRPHDGSLRGLITISLGKKSEQK